MKHVAEQQDGRRRVDLESPEATHALGVRLGRALQPGDFVGLVGGLGAGKTHFARGVAEGAGVDASEVSSPTYAVVQSYRGARFLLHHADLYRLEREGELEATGFFDLDDGTSALLVEWIDQVPGTAPIDSLRIELSHNGPTARVLFASAVGRRSNALLREWLDG